MADDSRGMPLCRTTKLDASRDYYVRIRARSKPHGTSLLGWASTIQRRGALHVRSLTSRRRGPALGYARRMEPISLTVNGRAHTVDVDPATPLLYVLSDDLALRGPKFGCGARAVRRVHGDRRRPRDAIVRDAGRHDGRRRDHDARRPGHAREAASDPAGVHRRAGGAVRLLPERRDPDREGVRRPQSEGDRRADRAGDVQRAVPLLHAHAHAARDQTLRAGAPA